MEMDFKSLPKAFILLTTLIGIGAPLARGADTNILLITVDTLRTDRVSCYSPKHLQTPRIDSLAARGVLFERAFAHTPMTLPSHTNILVGLVPPTHGVSENSKSVLAASFLTMAEHLKTQGYATAAFVSSFSLDARWGLNQGFDVYDDAYPASPAPGLAFSERPAEKTIAAALAWLSGQKGKWFCWVHLWDPHHPYNPPEPYATQFKNDRYSGEVAYVDASLGKLFDWLGASGATGRTLVVFTGDHGESLGEHGENYHSYFAYDSTIWIPLIIAGPATKSLRVKDYVCHVDIFPTVCEVLGVKVPPGLQGESLVPLMKGRTKKPHSIYFEALDPYLNRGWAPLRGFISEGRKYIESPIPELYDLEKDFDEKTNLAAGADLGPLKKRLEDMIKGYGAATPVALTAVADRASREKLRSLGYVAGPVAHVKASYGPEDDLKTLLPLEQKLEMAGRLTGAGRAAESVKLIEEIIMARPDFTIAYFHLSEIYEKQGLVEDRLRVLERCLRANPENYLAVSGYGIALVKTGRWEKGIEVLSQALGLFDQDAEVWNSLGLAYVRTGDFEKARFHIERALALDPKDAFYNENMGALYITEGRRLNSAQEVERSLAYFEKAIAADPTMASSYNGLAGALIMLRRTDEAIPNWEKAHELNPKFDYPVYNLAVAYLEKGDKAKALAYCQKYLEIKGNGITSEERRDIQSIIDKCK
jgi:arylsulfatase A-like enzyme/Flp pilus assembly protein TadD